MRDFALFCLLFAQVTLRGKEGIVIESDSEPAKPVSLLTCPISGPMHAQALYSSDHPDICVGSTAENSRERPNLAQLQAPKRLGWITQSGTGASLSLFTSMVSRFLVLFLAMRPWKNKHVVG
jgi:hypothetical protein